MTPFQNTGLALIYASCYTNHALDQFLEQLHRDGVKQIIRIGGRCKSSVLQPMNLQTITRQMEETKSEKSLSWKLRARLQGEGDELTTLFKKLRRASATNTVLEYLETEHPEHRYQLLDSDDEEGFKIVRDQRYGPVERWVNGPASSTNRARHLPELKRTPLYEMYREERTLLYDYWKGEIRKDLIEQIQGAIEQYSRTYRRLVKCNHEIRLRCLKQAHIIGITTSGLAKNVELLRRLEPKVLLCEEAGEILEAHTLTAFLPTIEHAILIGDHEQLRPQVQNYDLSIENPRGEKYSLDVSTFERLIMTPGSKIPHDTLQTQRRMDPSVSDLIRKTIYPLLKDHDSVLNYPPVAGFRHRLFWLDHREKEVTADPLQVMQTSQSNDHEVELVRALATHLVRQGVYEGSNIVVLTPYVRQLQKLRDTLSDAFDIVVEDKDEDELEDLDDRFNGPPLARDPRQTHRAVLRERLRLATVDNFQGEESDIVIVSLVRSNDEKRCGFLRTTNRINVLLSRAKHGLYIIGNSETYGHVPMWSKAIKMLKDSDHLGFQIPLCCPQHPDTMMEVSTPEDFLKESPEGGCLEDCDQLLDCGHICSYKCHSEERHNSVVCRAPCERHHELCGHLCTKHCGLQCHPCVALVDVQLPCGHTQSNVRCSESANVTNVVKCQAKVEQKVAGCGHTATVTCSKTTLDPHFMCTAECGVALPCGHECPRSCGECQAKRLRSLQHGACHQICGRKQTTCHHHCIAYCHGDQPCPPCKSPCSNFCSHSVCQKTCNQPCIPCVEPCVAGCVHQGFCRMPCSVPCDIFPCSRRCDKLLVCGHRCPSACGEPCPEWGYCQSCSNSSIKETIVNHAKNLKYEELELENNPILVPTCGHIVDIHSLDGYVKGSVPHTSLFLNPPCHVSDPQPLTIKGMKRCPACRGSLQGIHRYHCIIKRGLLDRNTKKCIILANLRIEPLLSALWLQETYLYNCKPVLEDGAENGAGAKQKWSAVCPFSPSKLRIGGPRGVQLHNISELSGLDTQCGALLKIREELDDSHQQISKDQRTYEAVSALSQATSMLDQTPRYDSHPTVLQTRGRLLSCLLLLRCEYDILAEIIRLHKNQSAQMAKRHEWLTKALSLDFSFNRQECLKLAHDAKKARQIVVEFDARMLFANYVALEQQGPSPRSDKKQILADARQEIYTAKELTQTVGSDSDARSGVQALQEAIHDHKFLLHDNSDEEKSKYLPMVQTYTAPEHWYFCENMHLVGCLL